MSSDSVPSQPLDAYAAADDLGGRMTSVNGWQGLPDHHLERLVFEEQQEQRLTHQLFRFPAKFHARVVRQLLLDYTDEGDRVLDPFCGSGTALVEAAATGRHAVGWDVDPLSVFISNVKSMPVVVPRLEAAANDLLGRLEGISRPAGEYRDRMHNDLDVREYEQQLGDLWVPAIPRLFHWFRRYVIIDLARLLATIEEIDTDSAVRDVLRLVFASSIRAASNADPVPVSGLERTKHMLERDRAGRLIDPFSIFERKLRRAVTDIASFQACRYGSSETTAIWMDATDPPVGPLRPSVQAVITSPPYHGAVDYYRRHQLEMFWLGLTKTQEDRLKLLDRYLGRPHVPQKHRYVLNTDLGLWRGAADSEARIRETHPRRADEFRHYCIGMARVFRTLAQTLPKGAPAVFVIGHSQWSGGTLDTSELFCELAGDMFVEEERLWYPVKNRHMSYARHNGANIDREFVLVFRRTSLPAPN